MQRAAGEEIPDLPRDKGLLRPGPHALELKAVAVDFCSARELCRERGRRRIHAGGDGGLCDKIAMIERAPGLAVLRRELREAFDRRLEIAPNRECLSIGEDLRLI